MRVTIGNGIMSAPSPLAIRRATAPARRRRCWVSAVGCLLPAAAPTTRPWPS
jgi:hypothetical protein